jgi:DNA-directed RNA polymerase subunit K/omega
MIKRPEEFNRFEYVVLCGLRATQLTRGCIPRVAASNKVTTTAQQEVAERKVVRFVAEPSV